MEPGTTTIKVFDADRQQLAELFGGPTHEAVRKLFAQNCFHPDGQRVYTDGMVPADDQEALNIDGGNRIVKGFFCRRCTTFVFPAGEK